MEVSVLFSEPKISQSHRARVRGGREQMFQCSSASRKFLNLNGNGRGDAFCRSFSALQRAENFSIQDTDDDWITRRLYVSVLFSEPKISQYTLHRS